MLFAPLFGALLGGFGARAMGDLAAQWCATALMLFAAVLAWVLFLTGAGAADNAPIILARWIESGTFSADIVLRLDLLSVAMAALITTFGAIAMLYSFGRTAPKGMFKKKESYRPRLFAHSSLLVFALLILILAESLPLLFAGWVAAGHAAHALIGFHYRRLSSGWAAMKLFVYQRVGDLGLLSALGLFFLLADSADVSIVLETLAALDPAAQVTLFGVPLPAAEFVGFALIFAVSTVLAQVGLQSWLAQGTEAPAPALALIHTIYAAGGLYLLVRFNVVFEAAPLATQTLVILGTATAIFGSSAAFVQTDTRRLVSMLCLAEMGLILLAFGAGLQAASLMHLALYGLSALLLFEVVGWLGQAMRHDYDLRHYGGLKEPMRGTFWLAIMAALSFTGIGVSFGYGGHPAGFGVFLSEAYILIQVESIWAGLPWLLFGALFVVSLALWRLVFMAFTGMARGDRDSHEVATDPPRWMWLEMFALAVIALLAGLALVGPIIGTGQITVSPLPGIACVAGLLVAWIFFNLRPAWPGALAGAMGPVQEFLREGWFIDRAIGTIITGPLTRLAAWVSERVDGRGYDRPLSAMAQRMLPGMERFAENTAQRPAWRFGSAVLVTVVIVLIWVLWAG